MKAETNNTKRLNTSSISKQFQDSLRQRCALHQLPLEVKRLQLHLKSQHDNIRQFNHRYGQNVEYFPTKSFSMSHLALDLSLSPWQQHCGQKGEEYLLQPEVLVVT